VAKDYTQIDEFAKSQLNCTLKSPFMSLSFMALLVIPSLKLSDKGLFDGNTFALANVNLGSYQLLHTLARYELVKNSLSVFGSVNNVFNVNFVENIGYSTLGRNFKVGFVFNF
jgi:hypothetical protein